MVGEQEKQLFVDRTSALAYASIPFERAWRSQKEWETRQETLTGGTVCAWSRKHPEEPKSLNSIIRNHVRADAQTKT